MRLSWCPDQESANVQHPASGMSMMEGPGPPATSRSTARSEPLRVAWILRSGDVSPPKVVAWPTPPSRVTQRILFPWSSTAGARSGSSKTTPRMCPARPRSWCTGWSGGWNPVRAHAGRGPTLIAEAHDEAESLRWVADAVGDIDGDVVHAVSRLAARQAGTVTRLLRTVRSPKARSALRGTASRPGCGAFFSPPTNPLTLLGFHGQMAPGRRARTALRCYGMAGSAAARSCAQCVVPEVVQRVSEDGGEVQSVSGQRCACSHWRCQRSR